MSTKVRVHWLLLAVLIFVALGSTAPINVLASTPIYDDGFSNSTTACKWTAYGGASVPLSSCTGNAYFFYNENGSYIVRTQSFHPSGRLRLVMVTLTRGHVDSGVQFTISIRKAGTSTWYSCSTTGDFCGIGAGDYDFDRIKISASVSGGWPPQMGHLTNLKLEDA